MLISIGLPAYKSQFLEKSIQSILDQTYKNFELIIVNDGSPYDISSVAGAFDDPRIKFFSNQANIGKDDLAAAWNLTLEKASGDYFVLASDDDFYEPSFLEKMVEKSLLSPSVNVFKCGLRIVDIEGREISTTSFSSGHENIVEYMWHRIVRNRNQMVVEFFFKTEALKGIGGFYSMPVGWGSDDISSFLMAQENGIVLINEPLCNWRMSGLNISTSHKYYYQKMLAVQKYSNWTDGFLDSLYFTYFSDRKYLELKNKYRKIFNTRLNENASKLIFYSGIGEISANLEIIRKEFRINIFCIIGVFLKSLFWKIKK